MVYSRIEIVVGVAVTVEQARALCEALGLEERIDDPEEPYFDSEALEVTLRNQVIQFFHEVCCIDPPSLPFILVGTRVRSYARKHVRCDDCTKYSTCDNCIGTTENGVYDVAALRATPTEVAHPCSHCFADSRNGSGTCDACNLPRQPERLSRDQLYQNIRTLLGQCPETSALIPKFYYVVNDCLSCS